MAPTRIVTRSFVNKNWYPDILFRSGSFAVSAVVLACPNRPTSLLCADAGGDADDRGACRNKEDLSIFDQYAWPLGEDCYAIWDLEPSKWRPINHSCDPNTWMQGLEVRSVFLCPPPLSFPEAACECPDPM